MQEADALEAQQFVHERDTLHALLSPVSEEPDPRGGPGCSGGDAALMKSRACPGADIWTRPSVLSLLALCLLLSW